MDSCQWGIDWTTTRPTAPSFVNATPHLGLYAYQAKCGYMEQSTGCILEHWASIASPPINTTKTLSR